MRLIGTLENESQATRLASYLKGKGIATSLDAAFETKTGHMSYQIWVLDEDKIAEAESVFDFFMAKPSNAAFDTPLYGPQVPEQPSSEEPEEAGKTRFRAPFTVFIIALCALVFGLNWLQESPWSESQLFKEGVVITPIQTLLFFDVPPAIEELEKVLQQYQNRPNSLINPPPDVIAKLVSASQIPFWRGAYDWVLNKITGRDTSLGKGPLFQKIRQGEIWRLISPVILHTSFLHILFNMLWVWILSSQVEQRIGIFRLLLLSLIVGVGSNVLQYLMSGPIFIGYSGIVTGLAGFIWMREKVAPWEGYPLQNTTLLFLLIYVVGVFLLQFGSFLMQILFHATFEPNIANTAHIAGGLIGAILGRLSFFSRSVMR